MKKAILIAACAASISALATVGASAQATGPQGQQAVQTNDPMNSNARMHRHRHHHMHKEMKSEGTEKGGMKEGGTKDGATKDGATKDGMKKDGTSK
jgi:hypothetical protein